MRVNFNSMMALLAGLSLAACATSSKSHAPTAEETAAANAFASTYVPRPSAPTLIRNATVFDGAGAELDNADVLMADGHIASVGQNLTAPAGATVIDGTGKYVTPGIIDPHSHLGVYPSPSIDATQNGNELTSPDTAKSGPNTRCGRWIRGLGAPSPAASPRCTSCQARAICSADAG